MTEIKNLRVEEFDEPSTYTYPDYWIGFDTDDIQFMVGSNYIEIIPIKNALYPGDLINCVPEAIRNSMLEQAPGVVYCLYCDCYDDPEFFKDRCFEVHGWAPDDIPPWAWAAFNHPTLKYIGGTYRPDERIDEHVFQDGEFEGSIFTKLFEPNRICKLIFPLSDDVYAFEHMIAEWEQETALSDEFIWQN